MQVRTRGKGRGQHSESSAGHQGPEFVLRRGRLVRNRPVHADTAEHAETSEPTVIHEVDPAAELSFGRKAAIVAFILSLIIPISFSLGPVRLSPTILFLLLAYYPSLVVWFFVRPTRLSAPDYLVAGAVLWSCLALVVNHGFLPMIERMGTLLVQMLGAFMLGRVLVRDEKSMMFMAMVAVISGCALLLPAAFEALTGQPVMIKAASLIGPSFADVEMEPRLGIHRAQGPFEHPILFGVFAASLVSLAAYCLPKTSVWSKIGPPGVTLTALPSLSAGPLLAMNVQFGLMVWARVFRSNPNRWKILGLLLVIVYVAIDLLSERTPFHVLVNHATFSSGSGYTRILIWEFGSAEAMRNPFFGIGEGDWVRPPYMSSSVDNFWLLQAMKYGMPACFMLMGGLALILLRARRANGPNAARDMLRRGAIFSLLGVSVAMGTVHLWNAVFTWFMFLMGASVWLGLDQTSDAKTVDTGRRKRA